MSSPRYRFGDVTRRSILGAVRPGQVVLALAGAVWAIAVIDVSPTARGAVAGALGLAAAVTASTLPVLGLTLEQWAPVALRWLLKRVGGSAKSLPIAAVDGTVVELPTRHGRAMRSHAPKPRPPRELRDVRLVEIPYRQGAVGAVSERRGRRLTLVLVGRAPGFPLADEAEQQQRLLVWGDVLKESCRAPVRRIQWVERTAPAQTDGLARWLHTQRDPEIPLRSPIGESYMELMNTSAQATREHEVLLAVQVDASLLRKDTPTHRERTLVGVAERIAQGLERARVSVEAALTAGGIARALRVAYDPYVRVQLAALRAGGGKDELSEPAAWPSAAQGFWDHYETDGAVHVTYEIAGWPRAEVGPAFLGSLLGPSEQVRSVAMVFEPLDPLRSIRQAEYDVTRYETDHQVGRRLGQVETSRGRQAFEAVRMREAELAAGHAEVRMAGFATVTAADLEELDIACEQIVGQAARANLELRRMYGQQPEAFTFTLPICRGLR